MIDTDRVSQSDVDASAIAKTTATINPNHMPLHVKQRASRIPGINGTVNLNTIPINQLCALSLLEPLNTTDDSQSHRRYLVLGQQKWVSHGECPVAHFHFVRITQGSPWKRVSPFQLDDGDISTWIRPNQFPVIKFPIVEAAKTTHASTFDDMVICECNSAGVNDHPRSTPLAARPINGNNTTHHLINELHPNIFELTNRFHFRIAERGFGLLCPHCRRAQSGEQSPRQSH